MAEVTMASRRVSWRCWTIMLPLLMIRRSTDNMRNRELRDPQNSKESAVPDDPAALAKESDILVDETNLTGQLCST